MPSIDPSAPQSSTFSLPDRMTADAIDLSDEAIAYAVLQSTVLQLWDAIDLTIPCCVNTCEEAVTLLGVL